MQNTYYKPGTSQAITVAVTSTACTNAFAPTTTILRIVSTAVGVWYKVATTPTAAITDAYLPANTVEYIVVPPGAKIAVIQPTTPSGTFNLTEMTG
jgi:hypothetical protein